MSLLVDNANTLYLLLGITAAGFVIACWLTKRLKYLGIAGCFLALIGLMWLLTQFFISDRRQIEMNVHAMADAVVAGKVDDLFQHISEDFFYDGRAGKLTRKMVYVSAQQSVKAYDVSQINIAQFEVQEFSRAKKTAKVSFKVVAFVGAEQQPHPFVTKAQFVLEGEQWKLKTMEFYKSFVNTDQKLDLIP